MTTTKESDAEPNRLIQLEGYRGYRSTTWKVFKIIVAFVFAGLAFMAVFFHYVGRDEVAIAAVAALVICLVPLLRRHDGTRDKHVYPFGRPPNDES
jgi:hypothetical protein